MQTEQGYLSSSVQKEDRQWRETHLDMDTSDDSDSEYSHNENSIIRQKIRKQMIEEFRVAMKQNKLGQPVRLNGLVLRFDDSGQWAINLAKKEFRKKLVWRPVQ